jgi:hypothetical protein
MVLSLKPASTPLTLARTDRLYKYQQHKKRKTKREVNTGPDCGTGSQEGGGWNKLGGQQKHGWFYPMEALFDQFLFFSSFYEDRLCRWTRKGAWPPRQQRFFQYSRYEKNKENYFFTNLNV